jgi:uncharacterized membrane protein
VAATGAHRFEDEIKTRDAFWPAQLAIAAAIGLYYVLPGKLIVGPNWLMPIVEGALLLGLIVFTPHQLVKRRTGHRNVALALIALVSVVNLIALGALVHFLVVGGKTGGHPLLLAGVEVWGTNVLIFAVWFWELDRGGPLKRAQEGEEQPRGQLDFMFPQMSDPDCAPEHWKPNFVDYLYVSFTNATAFSPTDTMPLTAKAKLLMLVQSLAALVTVGLVAARAVNILG